MQKSNTIYFICKEYLTIDNNGRLDFKSPLKQELMSNKISKYDAIYIVLDLLYSVKINLKQDDVSKKLLELLNDVKIYNNNLKHKILFFKPYLDEIHIIIDYITLLADERNIQDNFNNNRNDAQIKSKVKSIKKNLNRFSREDLFVILDLNSSVNFEKDKILKNRIATELSKISFDESILENSSPEEIKKLLNSNHLSNKEIIRLQNEELYRLIKEFEKRVKERSNGENIGDFKQKQKIDLKELRKKDKIRKNNEKSKPMGRKEKLSQNQFERIQQFKKEKKLGIYAETPKKNITKQEQLRKELNDIKLKNEIVMVKKQELVINANSKHEKKSFPSQKNLKTVNNVSRIKKSNTQVINKENKLKSKFDKELNKNLQLINEFISDITNNGYISSEIRDEKIKKYMDLYKYFSKKKSFTNKNVKMFLELYNDLKKYTNLSETSKDNRIRKINEKYLDNKINKNKKFFTDITDIYKKRAIVIDEKNVKVIAGAGTGKTFTIQNKVRYLIEHEGVLPEKILCLCYTGKGAEDLNEKVNEFSNGNYKIAAYTFHGFCRDIIQNYYNIDISSKKDNLLEEIILNFMRDIVNDDEKLEKLVNYFSYYNTPPADDNEFTTYEELLAYETGRELKQLKEKFYGAGKSLQTIEGKIVRSIGELMIANYLFMHDIEYEYELEYQHNFSNMIKDRFLDSGHYFSMGNISNLKEQIVNEYVKLGEGWEDYCPDFYFPEKQIYLEHFGIGGKDDEKWLGKDYLKQMDEKREYHKKNGTKLIETYYYYLVEEKLLEELEKLLIDNNIKIGQKDRKSVLEMLTTTKKVDDFKIFNDLVSSFINIFEANNLHKKEFDRFKNKNQSEKDGYKKKRQELFLDIVSDIYNKYFEANEPKDIDYNRQVSLALELIQSKKFNRSYDYILVDEYQDINPIRCQFLQELQKNTHAKMFVVGDDWQSIYGFNGSDLKLFIDFDRYFPNSELIKIEENRRNCQELNNIACKFIRKNEIQEKKTLKSIKTIKDIKHPIRIIRYDNKKLKMDNILKLYLIIENIIKNNPKRENTKILLLGRGNKDIDGYIDNILFERDKYNSNKIICTEKPKINIQFMTIHKSKGLEFDEVVILNFEDKINGFPNKIEDDPLLRFVKNNKECRFAEERRLLYVALTRTKNRAYLLAPKINVSKFIWELIELNAKNYQNLSNNKEILKNYYFPERKFVSNFELRISNIKCPNCDEGKITIVRNTFDNNMYVRCSTDPTPDSKHYNGGPFWGKMGDVRFIEKCPSCNGILIKGYSKDQLVCTNNKKGCNEKRKLF